MSGSGGSRGVRDADSERPIASMKPIPRVRSARPKATLTFPSASRSAPAVAAGPYIGTGRRFRTQVNADAKLGEPPHIPWGRKVGDRFRPPCPRDGQPRIAGRAQEAADCPLAHEWVMIDAEEAVAGFRPRAMADGAAVLVLRGKGVIVLARHEVVPVRAVAATRWQVACRCKLAHLSRRFIARSRYSGSQSCRTRSRVRPTAATMSTCRIPSSAASQMASTSASCVCSARVVARLFDRARARNVSWSMQLEYSVPMVLTTPTLLA